MKHKVVSTVSAILLSVAIAAPVLAQGRGRGFGGAFCPYGLASGQSAQGANANRQGRGPGGWWTRVTPSTPEQEAFLKQVTDIHNKIRALQWEVAGLRASNAPAAEIEKREKQIADLRAELVRVTTANEKLIREMGIPAPYGVCNGQGRGARMGGTPGFGRYGGRGFGPRNGTGPNPYCPLKN